MAVSDSAANGSPQPRLCHVVKVDTFDGYGFNLLAEQGRPGQYIGKVDEGSPAERAGLKQGDKILEVNGISIVDDNHKQVVQKIKAVTGETKLLVVTPSPADKVPVADKSPKPKAEEPVAEKKSVESKKASVEPKKASVEPKRTSVEVVKPPKPKEEASPREERSVTPIKDQPDMSKLNLGMSVAEMRAQIAAKKKADPKKVPMDFKSKFEIVKQL